MFKFMALLFVFSIAFAQDCESFQSLQSCTRLIDCFWNSRQGTCSGLGDYSQKQSDTMLSSCKTFGSMDACYLHLDCFWVPKLGDCEDLSNWELTSDTAASLSCEDVNDGNSCWSYPDCFWNRHIDKCNSMVPTSTTTLPIQTSSSSSTHAYSTPSISTRANTASNTAESVYPSANTPAAYYPSSQSPQNFYPYSAYTVQPQTTSKPRPCLGHPDEVSCWRDTKCFWDRRLNVCLDVTPGNINPFDIPISKIEEIVMNAVSTTAVAVPSFEEALGKDDPMHLCETFDEMSCRADDDCVLDEATLQCYGISDSDCSRLPSKFICTANEDCLWSPEGVCQSSCSRAAGESQCALEEDCIWEGASNQCFSIFSSCHRFHDPNVCVNNEVCAWNREENACISMFGPCTRHSDEAHCTIASQFNTHCEWGENPGQKDVFGCQDPFTTAPPIIECQALTDQDTCMQNTDTQANMPCSWDVATSECSVFIFDCEDYQTQATCEAASFRENRCFWDGECDFVQAGVLESIHIDEKSFAGPYILLAGFCGFISGFLIMRSRQSISTNLEQPLYSTPV